MINSIFSGDRATENGGGAIFNTGALSVARSSFVNNSVTNIYGGGGGIASNAYLYVVNSTFSGNLANVGGGVFSSDGTLSVVNTTFSGNSARAGGGIYFGGPTDEAILKDTIIADSAGGNCGGPIVPSGTYNLVTDASCGPSTTQTSSKELRLGPLQDNGGPTKTIAPQAGSVAIDAGDPVYCAAEPMYNRDQRGEARPQGLGCDVGAVEVKPSYYPPVAKDDSYTTVANPAQPLSMDAAHGLLPNDDDQDGDALTALLVSEPSYGKLALNADGSFTYIPSRGFAGSDSFTYRASDGSRESSTATVTIAVTP